MLSVPVKLTESPAPQTAAPLTTAYSVLAGAAHTVGLNTTAPRADSVHRTARRVFWIGRRPLTDLRAMRRSVRPV